MWHWPTPLEGVSHPYSLGWDMIYSTSVQNLTTLASANAEISQGAAKILMRHATLMMALLKRKSEEMTFVGRYFRPILVGRQKAGRCSCHMGVSLEKICTVILAESLDMLVKCYKIKLINHTSASPLSSWVTAPSRLRFRGGENDAAARPTLHWHHTVHQ